MGRLEDRAKERVAAFCLVFGDSVGRVERAKAPVGPFRGGCELVLGCAGHLCDRGRSVFVLDAGSALGPDAALLVRGGADAGEAPCRGGTVTFVLDVSYVSPGSASRQDQLGLGVPALSPGRLMCPGPLPRVG